MNTENNTKSVGRPEHDIKYPRGIFTVNDLYELNRGPRGRGLKAKVCTLTIRKHIRDQIASGFLTKVTPVKSGKVGQPAAQFIRTAVKNGLETARSARDFSAETVSAEPVDTTGNFTLEPVSAVEPTVAVEPVEAVGV